jgi:hypothetical protein
VCDGCGELEEDCRCPDKFNEDEGDR